MKSLISKQVERFLREQKNYKRWLAVFVCLAVVVTIGTTAALKYKGIAVTDDDPMTEEMHMEEATAEEPEIVVIDGKQYIRHVHTEACYEEQKVFICEEGKAEAGKAEDAGNADSSESTGTTGDSGNTGTTGGHHHDDSCYEVTGGTETLTCTKEEHSHGDGCYEKKTVEEEVTETVTKTDDDGNEYEEEVTKTVTHEERGPLTCTKEEHSHGSDCYDVEGGEKKLVCGLEEGEGATPASEVAEAASEPAAEEAPAVEPASEPVAEEVSVTKETGTDAAVEGGHIHTEECYELQKVLICGKEEGELVEIGVEYTEGTLAYEGEDYKVTISYTAEAKIPADAELDVKEYTEDSREYKDGYEQMVKALEESKADEEAAETEGEETEDETPDVAFARCFDITILANGEKIEPDSRVGVSVKIEFEDTVVEDEQEGVVVHFPDNGETEVIETNVNDGKEFNFDQKSFSETWVVARGATMNLTKPKEQVDFYVNINSKIGVDTSNQHSGDFSNSVNTSNVTGAVYTTEYEYYSDFPGGYKTQDGWYEYTQITSSYKNEIDNYGKPVRKVLVAEDDQNAMRVDGLIRKLGTSDGVVVPDEPKGVYGENTSYSGTRTTYKIDIFPSDEEVFKKLKNPSYRTKKVNGKDVVKDITRIDENGNTVTVNPNDLTTDNYTIRWYSFHFSSGDAWHVDGILVPKNAKIKITKTFSGDTDAINAIKASGNNFSITAKVSDDETISPITLKLTDKNVKVSEDKKTYEWLVNAIADVEYIIEENNYISGLQNMMTIAEYSVIDPSDKNYGSSGTYDSDTVKVVPESYKADEAERKARTVKLTNSYVPQNSVLVSKIDDTTKNGLAGVEFTLTKGGSVVDIWKVGTANYYLYDPKSSGIEGAEKVEKIVVDDGDLTILYNKNNIGSYTLTETELKDSNGNLKYTPVVVDFTIKESNNGVIVALPDYEKDGTLSDAGQKLEIPNKPVMKNITVQKEWAAGTLDDEKVSVTVKLFRKAIDGSDELTPVLVDGSTEIVLNADNGWKKENIKVPVYVDGKEQAYSIQETKIGTTERTVGVDDDPENKVDGYQFYEVTYTYDQDSEKNETCTVTNKLEDATLTFTKKDDLDQNLPGVKFALFGSYKDAMGDSASSNQVAEAVSGEDGTVTFTVRANKSFYMREISAPDEKYKVSDQIYKVVIAGEDGEEKKANIQPVVSYNTENGEEELGDTISPSVIVNEIYRATGITLKKVDNGNTDPATGALLPGAEFVLKVSGEEKYYFGEVTDKPTADNWVETENSAAKFTTNEDSVIELPNLEPGEYELIEKKAPDGYNLLKDPFKFKAEVKDGVVVLKNSDNGAEISDNVVVITNTKGLALPETGGPGTVAYTFGGLAMIIAVSLMYGLNMRRKREKGGMM